VALRAAKPFSWQYAPVATWEGLMRLLKSVILLGRRFGRRGRFLLIWEHVRHLGGNPIGRSSARREQFAEAAK